MKLFTLIICILSTSAWALKTEIVASNSTHNGKNSIVVKKVTGYTLSPSNITAMVHEAFIASNLVDVSIVESMLEKMKEDYRGSSGLSKTSQTIQTLLRSLYNDTILSSKQKMALLRECWQLSYLDRVKRFNLKLTPKNLMPVSRYSSYLPLAVSASALKLYKQIYTDETADSLTRAQAFHYTSQIYKQFYRRDEAKENLLKAEKLYKAVNNTRGLYEVNCDLANTCLNKREFEKSVDYRYKAFAYGKELPEINEYKPLISAFYTYIYDEKYDEAIEVYNTLLKDYKDFNVKRYDSFYEGAKKKSKYKFVPSYYIFDDHINEIPNIRQDWKTFSRETDKFMTYFSGLLDELTQAE